MKTRDYELNCEKAMKKKLYATTRDHAIVKVTGGGLKIEFSTGMNGHRDFRNGYHDFRKGHHDFRNGHHNIFRQHDLRNAHLDTPE
ncbi:hypothetical protein DPMN_169769 [Dreissena polymorpha]|uniref:Uncharacterized protein n=1 Tax=Dreissena polymorpha TaxID=45954 RepID=A0A9D4DYB7_DREPO|nr:hypothetical protein DPMN_169769 [Dreissena polymorpha]